MKRLTIFTPTYNRGYILPKLYESLCQQDLKEFVWLVVDDGSTDDTSSLLKSWQDDGLIDIRYYHQPNAGKTKAHNRGVELCDTELFVCIDSDDYLTTSSVVKDTLAFWDSHADLVSQPTVSGMVSYRKMLSGPQALFPELELATLGELYEAGYKGETTLVFKTEVLRKYLFPEIPGEKYVTEAYVYDQLDVHYKLLVFPYYSQVCEYRPDGITQNGWDVLFNNPKSYRLYYDQLVKLGKDSKVYSMKMYIACSLIAGDGKTFSTSSSKALLLLLFPLGLYQYYKLRHRKW